MALLVSRLIDLSSWVKILNHLLVGVMSDRRTTLFHIISSTLLNAIWRLHRALSFFVCRACCTISVVCCCRSEILTLIQFVSLFNWDSIFPVSSRGIRTRPTERIAPCLIFSLFTFSLASVNACRKRLWWTSLITCLIWNGQVLVDGVYFGAVLSWISPILEVACLLTWCLFLQIISIRIVYVLWIWCWDQVPMYTWWAHIALTLLSLIASLCVRWIYYLRLLLSIVAHKIIRVISSVFRWSWCLSLRNTCSRSWFCTVVTSTHNFSCLCILLRSGDVSFTFNFAIFPTCSAAWARRIGLIIWDLFMN